MTNQSPTGVNTPPVTLSRLRDTVEFMDCLSQNGFSKVSAIANLALSRLETPAGYHYMSEIAYALQAIRDVADDVENCINFQAEEVGCNYIDQAQRRRCDAQCQAREERRQ